MKAPGYRNINCFENIYTKNYLFATSNDMNYYIISGVFIL